MAHNEDIMRIIGPYANQYGNGYFGPSFADSYRNATAQRSALGDLVNDDDVISDGTVDMYDRALRAQQGQAIAGGIVSGLTGATSILTNAAQSAQIRDTSMQEGAIADLSRAGAYNYNNYDQLANDYAQTNFGGPNISYSDIRGMNTGQKIGSVGTSALQGAATGLQIGGPWGALIGGVVGLGAGLGGVFMGDSAARAKQNSLNLQADLASDSARQNFAAAHERIGDNMHGQNAVNAVAKGGLIRRQSIQEYADKVLRARSTAPKMREHHGYGGKIQRIKGENGLTIRIKK